MANKIALGLVIGGVVSSTVGAAFKDVSSRIKRLEAEGSKARILQKTIGETIRLRDEWRKAHLSGDRGAASLQRKLDANLDGLRRQGIEVRNLTKAYSAMGEVATKAELKAKGHMQLDAGKQQMRSSIGQAAAVTAAIAIPTKVSADFGAIIRDIAIKANIANKPEEQQMAKTIIGTSRDTGMARNQVAEVVNALVGAGMELKDALSYAPVAAKFAVGQGADGGETARMINALGQNAKISDPAVMQKALEAIAFQGQAGSFEAADMAKWFPDLLAGMGNIGITGMDAVTQLGSMLQVQIKTAGGADEAANNLKNWMSKIGSGETVKAYKEAGIDYQGSMNTGLQSGKSTLESSFELAQKYIAATDPKKAAAMAEATAKISKETDPEKAKAMIASLEQALRTGDLFADMQVKGALTAYMQGRGLYSQLKRDSADATGILDRNLEERRQASSQKWAEMAQGVDDAMRAVGDAIRPITDAVADGIKNVAQGLAKLADGSPRVVAGAGVVVAAVTAISTAVSAFKMGKGLLNLARGSLGGGKPGGVQKVFVTNAKNGGDGDGEDAAPTGKVGRALTLAETGLKAVASLTGRSTAGEDEDDGEDKPKKFDVLATGLKVVALAKEAAGGLEGDGDDADGGSGGGGIQRVYVVNASAIGGAGGAGGQGGRRRRGRQSSRRRGGPPAPPPPPPPRPPAPPPGALSRLGAVAGKVGKVGKMIPGSALIEAGGMALDTYENAQTQDEKAEGYGEAAGTMAGTMAGAAAGAAIGSVVPIIGTAIGGLVGAYLGSMGGSALGGALGKSWFGSDDEKPAEIGDAARDLVLTPASAEAAATMLAKSQEGVAPTKIESKVDIQAPFTLTVQGDVKDASQLYAQMRPFMEQHQRELAQQLENRKLYDAPNV